MIHPKVGTNHAGEEVRRKFTLPATVSSRPMYSSLWYSGAMPVFSKRRRLRSLSFMDWHAWISTRVPPPEAIITERFTVSSFKLILLFAHDLQWCLGRGEKTWSVRSHQSEGNWPGTTTKMGVADYSKMLRKGDTMLPNTIRESKRLSNAHLRMDPFISYPQENICMKRSLGISYSDLFGPLASNQTMLPYSRFLGSLLIG